MSFIRLLEPTNGQDDTLEIGTIKAIWAYGEVNESVIQMHVNMGSVTNFAVEHALDVVISIATLMACSLFAVIS